MTYASAIVTRLNADATLMSYLTGGVHDFSDVGRKGINRLQVPGAYSETSGLLKPVAVVIEADETPDGQAVNASDGFMSTVTPIYIFIYDSGDAGYATIKTVYDRIYSLLHTKQLPGAFQILWTGTQRDKREPLLKDAGFYRADFRVHGYRSAT